MVVISSDLLISIAKQMGIEIVRVSPIDHAIQGLCKEPKERLILWQKQGFAANMRYMMRDPQLLSNPKKLFDSAKTIISLIVPYNFVYKTRTHKIKPPNADNLSRYTKNNITDHINSIITSGAYGRVARYAWGDDYHHIIKSSLAAMIERLSQDVGFSINSKVFVDAVPLLERSISAGYNGLFIGKNSMLIKRGIGSYFFLAEILCNISCQTYTSKFLKDNKQNLPGAQCKTCNKCIVGCPSKALLGDGFVDSNKCISYLTIEKKGFFSEREQKSIGSWIFGCDECQILCPFNSSTQLSMENSPYLVNLTQFLSIEKILFISSKDEFFSLFSKTAIIRAGWIGLARNALAVLANTRYFKGLSAIEFFLEAVSQYHELQRAEFLDIQNYVEQILLSLAIDAEGKDRLKVLDILGRLKK